MDEHFHRNAWLDICRNKVYGVAPVGWIQIVYSLSSVLGFNALTTDESNQWYMYPMSVFQYDGTNWNRLSWLMFQNNTWKSTSITLFPNTQYTWTGQKMSGHASYPDAGNVAITATYMQFSEAWIAATMRQEAYTEPVDLTNYVTIRANISSSYSTGMTKFLAVSSSAGVWGDLQTNKVTTTSTTQNTMMTLDVTNLTGNYYIYTGQVTNGGSNGATYIDNVYIE